MTAPGTILVIEDDGATRDLIAEVLSDAGYTVRLVSDGIGGITALADEQPHLILVDNHVPRASGLAFVRSIQSLGISVPIGLMTTDTYPPDHSNLPNIVFCLLKPFELDELLDRIAEYIN